jgi:hypothetical protein
VSTTLGTGVTAGTVKVGINYVDFAAIRNVINIDQGDFPAAYTSVINDINAGGGIHGRKIVPVFSAINPIGNASADAACTKLTEDERVFVAVGFFLGDGPLCYVKTHSTPIIGTSLTSQQAAGAKAPAFDFNLSTDHLAQKAIPAFADKGIFTGHKVAVVGSANDQTVMQGTVLPALEKANVDVVATAINDAPATDLTALYRQYALISQKFQSAGADVVVMVQNAAGAWPRATQVNHSSYHPRLVATRLNDLITVVNDKTGIDPAIMKDAVAASPSVANLDVWNGPGMQDCINKVKAAHPNLKIGDPTTASPTDPATWTAPEQACSNMSLLTQILEAAGTTPNLQSFTRGGESLKNVHITGIPVALNYGPDAHDGDGPAFIYSYDPSVPGAFKMQQ